MKPRTAWAYALVALLLSLTASAHATTRTRISALVIGNNQPFAADSVTVDDPARVPLRFADDDAAAMFDFLSGISEKSHLLTIMDSDTQALYPKLVSVAQVPGLSELHLAVDDLAARIKKDKARGYSTVVFVFFSGHGTVSYNGTPALALFDGGITKEFLYNEILQRLPADYIHLLIDACHAEAIVRPRDVSAEVVSVNPTAANAFLVRSTLERFPHVGAIMAASSGTRAHEWEAIRHGVFTHELLSALRGAADVNRDRQIEYSEIYAFMAAANRSVSDPRARLSVVARPPSVNRRAPLVQLSEFPKRDVVWLTKVKGQGLLEVGDELGRRLATLHASADLVTDLVLPAIGKIYVRVSEQEAQFRTEPGQAISFDSLKFVKAAAQARGDLEDALERGFFASRYGRGYYEGFIDQTPGFIAVPFPRTGEHELDTGRVARRKAAPAPDPSFSLIGAAGVAAAVTQPFDVGHGLMVGLRPLHRSGLSLSIDAIRAADGPLGEWQTFGSFGWFFALNSGPLQLWLGGAAGGGVIHQSVRGAPTRRSGLAMVGPELAASAKLTSALSMWSELQLAGRAYREDGATVVDVGPSFWLGAGLGL